MNEDMTRVECVVRDKDVGKVQRLLVGIALQAPVIQPVVNARLGKNGIKAETGGSLCELLLNHVAKHKLNELTVPDLKAWLASVNRAESSVHYAVKCGIEAGYLRRVGEGKNVRYLVSQSKAQPKRKKGRKKS